MSLFKQKQRKKVGLVLGSGGFRGFAHIGVLQILQENNIKIDFISGASIGSLVAACFAVYGNLHILEDEIIKNKSEKMPSVFDLSLRGSMVVGKTFEKFLKRVLEDNSFNDCCIPLSIVATDLKNGREVVLNQGNLGTAVRASSSVPLIFKPVKYAGHLLVDGALSNPVPVNVVKEMGAEIIIAVNLYHPDEFIDKRFNLATVALRSTRIAFHNLARNSIKEADIILNPNTSDFIQTNYKKYFDSKIAKDLIDIGRSETKRHLPQIKKILEQ